MYGVKGANGVILITTKRGTEGKAKISASASTAIKLVSKLPETYGSADALYYANQAIKHELGLSPSSWGDIRSTEFIDKYNAPAGSIDPETGFLMSERYPDVDWQKELFKDYAMSYNANVNIAGGTKAVKYYAAIDYQHEGDLFREWDNNRGYTSGYGFNRINVRSNLDFQLTKTTTLKETFRVAMVSASHLMAWRKVHGLRASSGRQLTQHLMIPSCHSIAMVFGAISLKMSKALLTL